MLLLLLALLTEPRPAAAVQQAERHLAQGRTHAAAREWDKAVAELAAAVRLNPRSEDAHFRLAEVHLFRQDFSAAVKVLENAKTRFAKSAQIELALGVAYYGQRTFAKAVDQFLRTMTIAPDTPQPYIFLGRILEHAAGRMPEVTERFADFQKRNPSSHVGYLLHAKALIAQLSPDADPREAVARELLEKSLGLNDQDSETHYQLALLLERGHEFEKAATYLERSVQLNPREAAPHFRLARVYERLGRREDAARERELHEKLSESGSRR